MRRGTRSFSLTSHMPLAFRPSCGFDRPSPTILIEAAARRASPVVWNVTAFSGMIGQRKAPPLGEGRGSGRQEGPAGLTAYGGPRLGVPQFREGTVLQTALCSRGSCHQRLQKESPAGEGGASLIRKAGIPSGGEPIWKRRPG